MRNFVTIGPDWKINTHFPDNANFKVSRFRNLTVLQSEEYTVSIQFLPVEGELYRYIITFAEPGCLAQRPGYTPQGLGKAYLAQAINEALGDLFAAWPLQFLPETVSSQDLYRDHGQEFSTEEIKEFKREMGMKSC
jgi:hypothetical protein